jgi:hypothetical protein
MPLLPKKFTRLQLESLVLTLPGIDDLLERAIQRRIKKIGLQAGAE